MRTRKLSASLIFSGCSWLVVLLVMVVVADEAEADLITNLSASADTSLFQTDPDGNMGGYADMPCGGTSGNAGQPFACRPLIKFDLSALPQNATINSATLTLQLVKMPILGPGSNVGLHRVLQDWGEGTENSRVPLTALDGEATWNNRFHPSTPWGTPGGAANVDYLSSIGSTIFANQLGTYTFNSTAGVVSDVQFWLAHPQQNYGWMLISDAETSAGTARRFGTRESTMPPILTIHYSVAAPPVQPTISQVALVGNTIRFSFNAEANRTYAVETRSSLTSGTWGILTNIPAQANPVTIPVTDSATAGSAFYRIRTP